MGRANIDKLMQMLTTARPVAPFESKDLELVTARVDRDGMGNFDDFMDLCARQCAAMVAHLTGEAPRMAVATATARRVLDENYPEGVDAAFFDLEMGRPGEMRHILIVIYDALSREKDERFFSCALHQCVNMTDPNDVQALATQYIGRYGQMVFGNTSPDPALLAPRCEELIREHVAFVRAMQAKFGACEIQTQTKAESEEPQYLRSVANTTPASESGKGFDHA